jgi:hypothetical protein
MKHLILTLVLIKGQVIIDVPEELELETFVHLLLKQGYIQSIGFDEPGMLQFENPKVQGEEDTLFIFDAQHKLSSFKHTNVPPHISKKKFCEIFSEYNSPEQKETNRE